jgi:hypothetical protein
MPTPSAAENQQVIRDLIVSRGWTDTIESEAEEIFLAREELKQL